MNLKLKYSKLSLLLAWYIYLDMDCETMTVVLDPKALTKAYKLKSLVSIYGAIALLKKYKIITKIGKNKYSVEDQMPFNRPPISVEKYNELMARWNRHKLN